MERAGRLRLGLRKQHTAAGREMRWAQVPLNHGREWRVMLRQREAQRAAEEGLYAKKCETPMQAGDPDIQHIDHHV